MHQKKDENNETVPTHYKVTVWIFLTSLGWLALLSAGFLIRRCN